MRITLYIEECDSTMSVCESNLKGFFSVVVDVVVVAEKLHKKRRKKNWLELLHQTRRLDYLGSVVAADKASNVRRDNNR